MNARIYISAGAILTEDHRYLLTRRWVRDPGAGTVLFVMLNPSTADGFGDDPTIRRCVNFADRWGFGGIEVVNLFSYRSPSTAALERASEPTGPDNEVHVADAVARATMVVAAWGCPPPKLEEMAVCTAIRHLANSEVWCLARTQAGNPMHPLARGKNRTPYDKKPEIFNVGEYRCMSKELRKNRQRGYDRKRLEQDRLKRIARRSRG